MTDAARAGAAGADGERARAAAGTAPADAAAWLEAYAAAWRASDPDAAADLFAEDASYTFDPFGPGLKGRDAVRDYWRTATGAQTELDLRVEPPLLVDGDRAAAEWRASFIRDGEQVRLAACLLLRFDDDGRCTDLREYWRQAD